MAFTKSVYSAEPALPVLADSLLCQSESSIQNPAPQSNIPAADNEWNLKYDWKKGVHIDSKSVFRCGTVLGFSRLRGRSEETHEYIGEVRTIKPEKSNKIDRPQIPRYLLTSHLRSITQHKEPSTFIIYPGNFDAFDPQNLFDDLTSPKDQDQPSLTEKEAIQKMDTVQLLAVSDFQEAAQAIRQYSEVIYKLEQKRQEARNNPESETHHSSSDAIMLIVVGLDYLIEGVIRASNPGKGVAKLTAALRSLTTLSRAHDSHLSIVLVNMSGLGPFYPDLGRNSHSTGSPHVHASVNSRGDDSVKALDYAIHSVFHSEILLFPNLIMKTLDQGTDTHFLVSDVRRVQVLEVIKDRIGGSLGKWGVWNEHREILY
ncbi:uncharacterized protein N7511_010818 [Penicillium nucicola]|uniref:uncharacterized protein n=1 Tax=Penicillium nucicola TaxID=1850975 RepID=UPI0025452FDF|nr:uncharacterized protein N7511_010818 [Penicillium nucicola]KAJ5749122.1 hypothetical protein N7511_010818 [Penicillium nucicola]